MKLTINDDPALGPKVEIEGDGPDMFVIVNGVTIARRGHPDATEASTWVSLEPEWTVTSSEDERRLEIRILYHGAGDPSLSPGAQRNTGRSCLLSMEEIFAGSAGLAGLNTTILRSGLPSTAKGRMRQGQRAENRVSETLEALTKAPEVIVLPERPELRT